MDAGLRARRVKSVVGRRIVNERMFQLQVEELLRIHGWRYYHTHDSRGSQPGFPDLIAVRGKRLLAIELKMDKGIVTPAQREWLEALAEVSSVEAYLVRYSDDIGELVAVLLPEDELPF